MNLVRAALMYQILSLGLVGIWALLFPQGFYNAFPGFGMQWIIRDGAFNEHVLRDVGSLNLGMACATLYALVSRNIGAIRASAIAALVFSVPHLYYHWHHLENLPNVLERVLNITLLSGNVLIPILLLQQTRGNYEQHFS
jgi:hypothetical protein